MTKGGPKTRGCPLHARISRFGMRGPAWKLVNPTVQYDSVQWKKSWPAILMAGHATSIRYHNGYSVWRLQWESNPDLRLTQVIDSCSALECQGSITLKWNCLRYHAIYFNFNVLSGKAFHCQYIINQRLACWQMIVIFRQGPYGRVGRFGFGMNWPF